MICVCVMITKNAHGEAVLFLTTCYLDKKSMLLLSKFYTVYEITILTNLLLFALLSILNCCVKTINDKPALEGKGGKSQLDA